MVPDGSSGVPDGVLDVPDSAVDPDQWIQPFLAGYRSVVGSGSTDPGDIIFLISISYSGSFETTI